MTPPRDDDVTTTRCPICATTFHPVRRQRFCSHPCRQAAYRRRQPQPGLPPIGPTRARRDTTIYECPDCQQRYHAQQWCPDCNRPCRRIGPGGPCPHCDNPVAVEDLTAHHTPKTISNEADHATST